MQRSAGGRIEWIRIPPTIRGTSNPRGTSRTAPHRVRWPPIPVLDWWLLFYLVSKREPEFRVFTPSGERKPPTAR